MPRRGVTVGKFYPPHHGHRRLIEIAQSRCDQLSVLVGSRPDEDPPADMRARWLREMHPGVRFLVVDDVYPEEPGVWAEVTVRELGYVPDVVFAGEDYGRAWARHIGCAFEMVDRTEAQSECTGRAVRADPLGLWDCIDPRVRAFYGARIAVVGAESSGTTTMARSLADHYQTVWVPEYGREYYEERVGPIEGDKQWETAEFVHIASKQALLEDLGAAVADRVLVCDTDPFATELWHERYVGSKSEEVAAIARDRRYAIHLLTGIDIPFVQDGFRDGERIREWMHRRFMEELDARHQPYIVLEGGPTTRLRHAIERIDQAIGLSRLYRPVGLTELDLIAKQGWTGYPPRLDWQPIFYPVLNFEYAERIARDWNVRDSGFGAVTTCWVRRTFLDGREVRQVGGSTSLEYWVPSEELDEFNSSIVGRVEVVREYGHRRAESPNSSDGEVV
jgi:HTH-type transcriptional repressor of NAD biosynthesis genes